MKASDALVSLSVEALTRKRDTRPQVRILLADGTEMAGPLASISLDRVDEWAPRRAWRWYRDQRHYPGFYWCATTGGHVGYESLLERDRLVLADFDPAVTNIKSQPFLMMMSDASGRMRHIPDYLLVHRAAPPRLVNVKTPEAAEGEKAMRLFACVEQAATSRHWEAEVWTGANALYLANVHFLSGFRRTALIQENVLADVLAAAAPDLSLKDVERRSGHPKDLARPAVMHAIWMHRISVDLEEPLQPSSEVIACR
jgi:hypothetical protein